MRYPIHHHANRREFLGAGLLGTLGLALSPMMQTLLARTTDKKRAKACILIWLNGGPSHLDTFDPKTETTVKGLFKAIDTKVAGMQLCEHLPRLADQARHLAVIRSLTSKEADHDRAYFYLHTGNLRDETVEYPALGSVVAHEWRDQEGDLPSFVALNGGAPGGGFLGLNFDPYVVGNLDAPLDNLNLPDGVDEERLNRRLKALEALNNRFAQKGDAARVAEHKKFTDKALKLRTSKALKAFDLSAEKKETLKAYGIPEMVAEGQEPPIFAKACLMARRMIENGVRFVEVTLDGWDTHENNFAVVEGLCKQLDPALAALTADLATRGLLDETLVLCLGEFGRTPAINAQNGRDHWSEAFSMVLAGGGVKGGQVIGASDDKGEHVKDKPIKIPDLYASLLTAFGIDPTFTYHTPAGRPIKLAGKGAVVKELFS
jgi:uncharacterized protein (DUF1501 family)